MKTYLWSSEFAGLLEVELDVRDVLRVVAQIQLVLDRVAHDHANHRDLTSQKQAVMMNAYVQNSVQ